MPPFGTNEFCSGNDYGLKVTVALGTLGLCAGLFSLAALRRWGGLIGALIVALTALGISASVPDRLGCPPGQSLNYYLTLTPDNAPLCSSSADPIDARNGTQPVVDHRQPVRVGILAGGAVLVVAVASVGWLWREERPDPDQQPPAHANIG